MADPKGETVEAVVEAAEGASEAPAVEASTEEVVVVDHEAPVPVKEYTDAKGYTWQLNAQDAKLLGFAEAIEDKVVTASEPAVKTKAPRSSAKSS